MKRREFITLIGGAGALPLFRPLAARAQQTDRMRRIGVLTAYRADDPQGPARVAALVQGLRELGWTEGRNVKIDVRWGDGDGGRIRASAAELVELKPDAIVVSGTPVLAAVREASSTTPIVFGNVADPVAGGFIASLARPGGYITGFANFEHEIGGKWLGVLKEVAPNVTRVLFIMNGGNAGWHGLWQAIETAAPAIGVQVGKADIRDFGEFERTVETFARELNGGLIVQADGTIATRRDQLMSLAAKYQLPTVYPFRFFPAGGGLMSYGVDVIDVFRRTAVYVDRILRGEKPGDLPVQTPTKFELVINLKTAKLLGLDVPPALLATADEVIE
jgi:putative tryptophan/tyrosine transport system substrate-binding protein